MSTSTADWLETQSDRISSRQRAQADTAKLLATFASGVAATMVATALQVGATPSGMDRRASIVLGIGLLLTVGVVFLDRLTEADHRVLLQRSVVYGWSEGRLLTEFRAATLAATDANESVLRMVWSALWLQLAASFIASGLAVGSLLSSR
jgi:hypothetical protein